MFDIPIFHWTSNDCVGKPYRTVYNWSSTEQEIDDIVNGLDEQYKQVGNSSQGDIPIKVSFLYDDEYNFFSIGRSRVCALPCVWYSTVRCLIFKHLLAGLHYCQICHLPLAVKRQVLL